jgi:predicted DNA-binding transcriptional regulator YafY
MRADRLLSIVLLLQTRGCVTARELAERLEVSPRTIHRDMEALSAAGIPVVAERGVGGGWSLLEGYRTSLTGLRPAEVQALFLPRAEHLLRDLGLEGAADAALLKLQASLTDACRRDAEGVLQRIHVDGAGWHGGEEKTPLLPLLLQAVWQERRVAMRYRRGDGEEGEREVDPLGLVAKGRVWYLVAGTADGLRTFRVSRVLHARLTDETCARPAGFDLAASWDEACARFKASLPRYPATVRVVSGALAAFRRLPYVRLEAEGPIDTDGRITCAVQFETEELACAAVLGMAGQAEVLHPAALCERVQQTARAVAALHDRGAADEIVVAA